MAALLPNMQSIHRIHLRFHIMHSRQLSDGQIWDSLRILFHYFFFLQVILILDVKT